MSRPSVHRKILLFIVFAFASAACSREQSRASPNAAVANASQSIANVPQQAAQGGAPRTGANPMLLDPRTHEWIARNSLHFNASKIDNSTLTAITGDIDNKRVVFLGETMHGVAEYAQLKLSLVRTLHESLGFNVLAWEGPIWECTPLRSNASSYRADTLLKYCAANGAWSTEEARAVFQYVESTQRTSQPLALAGLVPTRIRADFTPVQLNAFAELVVPYDASLAQRTRSRAERLRRDLLGDPDLKDRISPLSVAPLLDSLSVSLAAAGQRSVLSEFDHARLTLAATSARTAAYALRRMFTSSKVRTASDARSNTSRQNSMAENLAFVADTLYPAQKTIVWTTNAQARRAGVPGYGAIQDAGMAGIFASLMPNHQSFSLGIFPSEGNVQSSGTKSRSLGPAPQYTVEAMLNDPTGRATYLKTRGQPEGAGTWWLHGPIKSAFDGPRLQPMRLNDEYDAVVVVAKVTPSHFRITDYSLR